MFFATNCDILPDMRRIGIFVERQRAWGRQLCEGIASFGQERADWELTTLERREQTLGAVRAEVGHDHVHNRPEMISVAVRIAPERFDAALLVDGLQGMGGVLQAIAMRLVISPATQTDANPNKSSLIPCSFQMDVSCKTYITF